MRWFFGLLIVSLLVASAPAEPAPEFRPLFNGKNFDGWEAFSRETKDAPTKQVEPGGTWNIEEGGILKCTGKPTGFLATKSEHADYVLKLEWRYPKELKAGNSGVLVHCQKENTVWPVCLEVQLRSGRAGDFWLQTAADVKLTVDPKRRDADDKSKRRIWRTPKDGELEKPFGEWNALEVTCKGGSISATVNGQVVNSGTECNLTKGRIALQSEGTEIHFRNVMLKPAKSR